MKTIRIERHLDSDTLHLPELRELIGKDVEITVREAAGNGESSEKTPAAPHKDSFPLRGSVLRYDDPFAPVDDSFPLRGSVLRDDDPFGPAIRPEDWDAP